MIKRWEKSSTLTVKPDRFAKCGLLSPQGDLYPCDYGCHSDLFRKLADWEEYPGWYDDFGFIHLDHEDPPNLFRAPDFEPTQSQIDAIFDWCLKYSEKLPRWLKTPENVEEI